MKTVYYWKYPVRHLYKAEYTYNNSQIITYHVADCSQNVVDDLRKFTHITNIKVTALRVVNVH